MESIYFPEGRKDFLRTVAEGHHWFPKQDILDTLKDFAVEVDQYNVCIHDNRFHSFDIVSKITHGYQHVPDDLPDQAMAAWTNGDANFIDFLNTQQLDFKILTIEVIRLLRKPFEVWLKLKDDNDRDQYDWPKLLWEVVDCVEELEVKSKQLGQMTKNVYRGLFNSFGCVAA